MDSEIHFQGGPLSGFSLRGDLGRLPDMVTIRYDAQNQRELLDRFDEIGPMASFASSGNRAAYADYKLAKTDAGEPFMQFAGWVGRFSKEGFPC